MSARTLPQDIFQMFMRRRWRVPVLFLGGAAVSSGSRRRSRPSSFRVPSTGVSCRWRVGIASFRRVVGIGC